MINWFVARDRGKTTKTNTKTNKIMRTKIFNYNRSELKCGILHFGVGNFHRAHLQEYTNSLMNLLSEDSKDAEKDATNWGICGAMLMPQDKALYEKLRSQDGEYTLTVCSRGSDASVETHWIGSLAKLLWIDNLEEIINMVESADTKIITLTITEGGYNLDSDAVQRDIETPQSPTTVFGIVAEGLRRRIAAGNGPVTILSCDNLQHNGDSCKKIFESFFGAQDAELADWVAKNVTFPNSMVDRITPATTPADVERLNVLIEEQFAKRDEAPVYCEDYIQWVVEDNFAAGRPAWERVGVEFTADVAPYENMKLSLLNASHTLLSYPSMLGGMRKVDEAMSDPRIVKFVEDFMNIDVTPYVPAPANTDLELYKRTLVERFANRSVSDQVQRLCGDGASKFPVYVMPIAEKMLADGADMVRIAYLVAAYRQYLKYRVDDNGEAFEIFEPQLTAEDLRIIESDDALSFLSISPFANIFANSQDFVELYKTMVERIASEGAMSLLVTL